MRLRAVCLAGLLVVLGSAACSVPEKMDECGKELSLGEIVSIVDRELADRFGSSERPLPKQVEIRRSECEYLYTEWRDPDVPGAFFGVAIGKDGQVTHFEYGH